MYCARDCSKSMMIQVTELETYLTKMKIITSLTGVSQKSGEEARFHIRPQGFLPGNHWCENSSRKFPFGCPSKTDASRDIVPIASISLLRAEAVRVTLSQSRIVLQPGLDANASLPRTGIVPQHFAPQPGKYHYISACHNSERQLSRDNLPNGTLQTRSLKLSVS